VLDDVLVDHTASMREVLAECLIGVYTLGSPAIGDFDLTSDIDFVVVTSRPIRDDELNRAQTVHTDAASIDEEVAHLGHPIRRASYLPPGRHQYRSLPRRLHAPKVAGPPL
jgi:predicted nucleotidyltransferase